MHTFIVYSLEENQFHILRRDKIKNKMRKKYNEMGERLKEKSKTRSDKEK